MARSEREEGFLERFHDRLVGIDRDEDDSTDDPADDAGDDAGDDGAWLDETWPRPEGADDEWPLEWVGNAASGDSDTEVTIEVAKGKGRHSATKTATARPRQTVATTLATELSTGAVDEHTRRTLEEHLGADLDTAATVRLDSVSARVTELEAYTDALETLLERVGTDDDVIARFEGFEATVGEIHELRDRLDDLRESVAELSALHEQTDSLHEELVELRREMRELRNWRRSLAGAFVAGDDTNAAVEG